MTNSEIAQRVKQAIDNGAPSWGVALLTEVLQLRAEFHEHLCEHRGGRDFWRQVWPSVTVVVLMALLVYIVAPAVVRLTP